MTTPDRVVDPVRSEAAKQAAKTRKVNRLVAEAEAAAEALPSGRQIALAVSLLKLAMVRAQSAARNALDSGDSALSVSVFYRINGAINGLKTDLDREHQSLDWYRAKRAKGTP